MNSVGGEGAGRVECEGDEVCASRRWPPCSETTTLGNSDGQTGEELAGFLT